MKILFPEDIKAISAQCIMPRLNIDDYHDDSAYKGRIKELVLLGVGGFCIFGGDKSRVEKIIQELQAIAPIPLLFAADFENGLQMRLSDGIDYPHAMAMGKNSLKMTYQLADAISREAKSIGVSLNLAPVADINSNIENPIINIRSFGETQELVASHLVEYVKGIQKNHIASCLKHFPGHGDTNIDSHSLIPRIDVEFNILQNREFIPFKAGIDAGAKCIMIGHLIVPAIDHNHIPATLSQVVISYVRNQLSFKGVIISDAFEMKGITNLYTQKEIISYAVIAGIDIILMPDNPELAAEIILELSQNADLDEKIRNACKRIIDLKSWCNLDNNYNQYHLTETELIHFEKIALECAYKSLELNGDYSLLPLISQQSIACLAVIQNESYFDNASQFFNFMAQAYDGNIDYGYLSETVSNDEVSNIKSTLEDANIVIIAFFSRAKAYQGRLGLTSELLFKLRRLVAGRTLITIYFGNPYISDQFNSDLSIQAFSDSIPSIVAAVMKLNGRMIE